LAVLGIWQVAAEPRCLLPNVERWEINSVEIRDGFDNRPE
jgi:hypothetical protein